MTMTEMRLPAYFNLRDGRGGLDRFFGFFYFFSEGRPSG